MKKSLKHQWDFKRTIPGHCWSSTAWFITENSSHSSYPVYLCSTSVHLLFDTSCFSSSRFKPNFFWLQLLLLFVFSSQSSQSAVPNQSSQCPPTSPPPCSSSSSSMSSSSSSSSLLGLETVQPQPQPPPPQQQQSMMGGPECLHGEWLGILKQSLHLVNSCVRLVCYLFFIVWW